LRRKTQKLHLTQQSSVRAGHVCVCVCVYISLCTNVVYNRHSSDNLPCYTADHHHHCSGVVYYCSITHNIQMENKWMSLGRVQLFTDTYSSNTHTHTHTRNSLQWHETDCTEQHTNSAINNSHALWASSASVTCTAGCTASWTFPSTTHHTYICHI